jgi:phosphatidate cytidylyltransferase
VAALLVLATFLSYLFHRVRPSPEAAKTLLRVRTWWVIAGCLFAAMMLGPFGIAGLFCLVSLTAMREFVALDSGMPRRRFVCLILAAGTLAHYAAVACSSPESSVGLVATLVAAIIGTCLVVALGSLGRGCIGLAAFMLGVGGLACVVGVSRHGPSGAGFRPVFLLLLLTGLNDVAQYLWGKSLGRRPVAPLISPRKTWAGLVGGVATTSVLAAGIVPFFIAENRLWGLSIGLLIGLGGFAGDILASAYKRRVGAGESGTLLPGHGGVIDRIDSLCLTAPLLYCALTFF